MALNAQLDSLMAEHVHELNSLMDAIVFAGVEYVVAGEVVVSLTLIQPVPKLSSSLWSLILKLKKIIK